MYTTLIESQDLAAHTSDIDWAILDCRSELARPEWGASAYAEGHIPNAMYAHLDRDLSSPVTSISGRHPLPLAETFVATLGRWGIDENVQVVACDQSNGAYASRLWWLLRWVGHSRVAVLNGGFAAWQQAGLPVSKQPGVRQPRRFTPNGAQSGVVSTVELEKLLAAGQLATGGRLIDARAADRFAGRNETIDPVAGHVPGAGNHPFAHNLDAQGRFLPPHVLRSKWLETLRGQPPATAIAMCGSGVTACHNLLALEVAGLPGAQLYAGSWSEWIRDAARPTEPPRK
ncbi:MAG TPA: sulfurtransferase [Steroidobacteraceae bacterium]|nr:sulfurtransferase [Steroidobacteraceae bacterium]